MQVLPAIFAHQTLLVYKLLVKPYLPLEFLDVEAVAFSGLLCGHSIADLLLTFLLSFDDLFGLDICVQSFLLKL